MRRPDKNLILYVLIMTVVLLGWVGVSRVFAESGNQNPVVSAADFLFRPVQSLFSKAKQRGYVLFETVSAAHSFRAENERLKEEIASLKQEERSAVSAIKENERLRALLDLEAENAEYDMVACEVIAKDGGNLRSEFQVSKGKRHGITVNDPVVVHRGLVGKVTAVSDGFATVTPIIDASCAVGARIVRTQALSVAEGGGSAQEHSALTLRFFAEDTEPVVGDVVETSGIGGVYPQGLLLGTVREVHKNGAGVSDYAELDAAVNFAQIHEVMIIRSGQKQQE